MRVYAVVSEQMSDGALELFVDRQMAELLSRRRVVRADRRGPCPLVAGGVGTKRLRLSLRR
jgi:hypothetical protein